MDPQRHKGDGSASLLDHYAETLVRLSRHQSAELSDIRRIELRQTDSLMRNIVEHSFDGILTIREDGTVGMVNEAAQRMFGAAGAALEGSPIATWIPALPTLQPAERPGQASDRPGTMPVWRAQRELEGRRQDGRSFPLELSMSEIWHERERLYVAILRDATERRSQQEQLRHQALHDALTGLPNRTLLMDRLGHALEAARRDRKPMGLLLVDLDRFKEVNDTLGHHVGDLVLQEVALRMSEAIRRSDTIARLGGDEFAILLPAVSDLARAQQVSARIVAGLERSFQVVEGLSLEIGVSIGIALYPDHADECDKLLQCADVAMYTAKETRGHTVLYNPSNDHNSVRHLTLTGELRKAIENGDLEFHYQPKIDLASRTASGVEALVRWSHPVHGEVPPDEFIHHAEQTGLIRPLSLWAFDTALAAVADWQRRGLALGVAINLSTRNLHEKSLPALLDGLLAKWSVDPGLVTMEITESALMVDPDSALDVVEAIHDRGFRLSIDDFGTGYSSLSYLKRLPVDELKIDKSFVMQMTDNDNDSVIVRSTIDLAHNLSLEVVAEGVQCAEHMELLAGLGCDAGQGYFFSRPLPQARLTEWLAQSPFAPEAAAGAAE